MDDLLLPGEPVTENIGFTVPGHYDFNGNSGAPVILNKTGEVLGVLLKAVDVGREIMLEFAPLSFSAPFAPKPLGVPPAVFSFVPRQRASGFLDSNAFAIFPPELFEATLRMSMEELWSRRPFLSAKGDRDYYGQAFAEFLGKRNGSEYLFHEARFIAVRGKLSRLELRGYGWTTNVSAARIENMFDWFFQTIGPPHRAVDLTKKDGRPGHGGIYCYWTNSSTILALGAQATGKEFNPKPWLSLELEIHPPGKSEFDQSKVVPLATALPSLQRELRHLLRDIAELPPTSINGAK
jgi:hypothetical protein